ncbi:hypothetical protein [Sphingobium nicotianae]|uniref:Lipoprotein n=1 Tax=Sphingobium nicotianae TaxID=2782607 RepID=A0A9X1DFD8_9SPHN|nr:hypothetical protein [Sphingobium nicotianae]MBT2188904.1 hypothetical protein [Sphingobium nicotianae]
MSASLRSICLVASLALLSACQPRTQADNLADLDAKLTNGADNMVNGAGDADEAIALAAAGGRIEKAPAAVETKHVAPAGHALGDLAGSASASGQGGSPCAKNVKYGNEWADRMPEAFRVYPGAKLAEAAGVDEAHCTLRIISFTTATGIDPIIDYYYTLARRAGYDGEHLVSNGEHQLGGTNPKGAAYIVFARRLANGQSEVDVVANAQ